MCLYIQSVHICTPMEDRGQLPGVGPLILSCDPGDRTQVVRLGGECLYLLRHLVGPLPYFLNNDNALQIIKVGYSCNGIYDLRFYFSSG